MSSSSTKYCNIKYRPVARYSILLRVVPVLALIVGTCAIKASAQNDLIQVANGEILQGTIIQEGPDFILFRSVSFGEIKITRTPGLKVSRSDGVVADLPRKVGPVATKPLPSVPAATPPSSSSFVKQTLGLSDRWNAELSANLLTKNDAFQFSSKGAELTIGYRVPDTKKPDQTRHEYGLFASYNNDKVNSTVVGENSEVAVRYFFFSSSKLLLVSQADSKRDRINGIESESRIIVVPTYRVIETKSTRLLAGVGPSYLFDSQIVGASPTKLRNNSEFRLAGYQLLQHAFSPRLTYRQTLVLLSRSTDPADTYNLRFSASLRRMLTTNVSTNLVYDYVRNENKDVLPFNARPSSPSIATLRLMLGYSL